MDVKINRLNKFKKGSSLKAFVDLVFYGEIIVKGFKLVEGKQGLFLSNPSDKGKDDKYFDTVRFLSLEDKNVVEQKVIEEYNKGE